MVEVSVATSLAQLSLAVLAMTPPNSHTNLQYIIEIDLYKMLTMFSYAFDSNLRGRIEYLTLTTLADTIK